ncbi:MAG: Tar ligand binding domain-containing protein [bacterium]
MAKITGGISWILLILVVIVAIIVGTSIWHSLRDTRAALDEQKKKVAELTRADSLMRAYVDSLDRAFAELQREEQRLRAERERLEQELTKIEKKYAKVLARLDTVWTAGAVIHELDSAFPHWKGQIREATRGDGVHALIVPRFFGADAAETKIKLDKSEEKMAIKDSTIAVLDSTLANKSEQVKTLLAKADTLQKSYDRVWGEYKILDEKYRKLLVRKWFTLHLGPGNILSAGIGATAGYLIGKQTK